MSKWKCEICGVEFENFNAQGFDNKIYCPLCYFKRENQDLKKQLEKKYEKVGTFTAEILYEENTRLVNEIKILKTENQKLNEKIDMLINNVAEYEYECNKYKEVIDKTIEYIEKHKRKYEFLELNEWQTRDLLDILKR